MTKDGKFWHQNVESYDILYSNLTGHKIFKNRHLQKFLVSPDFSPFSSDKASALLKEFAGSSVRASSSSLLQLIEDFLHSSSLSDFCQYFDAYLDKIISFSPATRAAASNLIFILHREGVIATPLHRREWFSDRQISFSKIEGLMPVALVNKCGRNDSKLTVTGLRRGTSYANILYTPLFSLCGIRDLSDFSADFFNVDYIMATTEGFPTGAFAKLSANQAINRLFDLIVIHINSKFEMANIKVEDYNPSRIRANSISDYFDSLLYEYPLMQEWVDYGRAWFNLHKGTKSQRKAILRIFISQLNPLEQYHSPKNYFLSSIKNLPIVDSTASNINMLQSFLNFVYEKVCIQEDPQHGKVYEAGYDRVKLGQKERITPNFSTVKEKIPQHFIELLQDIIVGDNYAWPKSQVEDYFDWINPQTGNIEKVWYPGRANVVLLMLYLPIRLHQALHLTSGHGDSFRLVLDKEASENWYSWTDSGLRGNRSEIVQRGVVRPLEVAPGNYVPTFYISTNKTHDRNKKAIDKGYVLPYSKKEAFELIYDFKEWTNKYVSPVKLIPYNSLTYYQRNYSKEELQQMGSDYFLWLDPCLGGVLRRSRMDWFWYKLMKELETRWNENAEPNAQVKIVYKDERERMKNYKTKWLEDVKSRDLTKKKQITREAGRAKVLRWTMHCLRVTGITCMMDNGVSVDVIRAIAGHASQYMTMYYVVRNPLDVEKKIQVAQEVAHLNATDECTAFIRANSDKPEFLSSRLFAGSTDFLYKIDKDSILPDIGTGLCMVGCNGCDIGYETLVETGEKIKKEYKPVPNGKESCELCRFYLSHPSYTEKLRIRWNYLYWISREYYQQYKSFVDKINQLVTEKEMMRHSQEIFHKFDLVEAYQRQADIVDDKLRISTLLFQKVSLILQQFQGRQNELSGSLGQPAIYGNTEGIKLVAEACHPFVALHNILTESYAEPFINPQSELPYLKLAQLINQMYEKSGIPAFTYKSHGDSREKQLIKHCEQLRNLVPPDYYDQLFDPDNFSITLRSLGFIESSTNTLVENPLKPIRDLKNVAIVTDLLSWNLREVQCPISGEVVSSLDDVETDETEDAEEEGEGDL